jgi:hypothetical protein
MRPAALRILAQIAAALAAAVLAAAPPAFAGTCTSIQDCAQGNAPTAAVILIGVATLLGLVCFLAMDGAFGPATADDFKPADETWKPPSRRTPERGVDIVEETPAADLPEFGPDNLFARPPQPRLDQETPSQSLFRAEAEPAVVIDDNEAAKADAARDARFEATAKDREAFDDKLDGLAKAYKPDDADYAKVATSLDDDGTPTDGSINYFNRKFDNNLPIYKVTVDAEGDPIGAGSTPAGRAFQALQGFMPEGPASVSVSYAQDKNGATFIDRVRVKDENDVLRADLQFNEQGQAWLGEKFDADGKRTGVLDNPDMAVSPEPPPAPPPPPEDDI